MIFRNADLLIKQLNEDNSRFAIKVIAIDGKDGVGKSTLAKKIAINLNGSYLELDQFIEKNKGHYVSAIKKDDLLNEIRNNSNKKPVLIEGICAQEVLKSLNMKADVLIYVKQIDEFGDWFDEYLFESLQSPEEVFQKDEEHFKQFRKLMPRIAGSGEIDEYKEAIFHEIVRYHYKYKPHNTANHIFNSYINTA